MVLNYIIIGFTFCCRIKELEKQILASERITLEKDKLQGDLKQLCNDTTVQNEDPFLKAWHNVQNRKQLKAQYPLNVIHYCLMLYAKGPKAYKQLRESNLLVLPSERTLQRYRYWYRYIHIVYHS